MAISHQAWGIMWLILCALPVCLLSVTVKEGIWALLRPGKGLCP